MSLVLITLGLLLLITILSIVLGSSFVEFFSTIGINNEAFVNGSSNTFVVNDVSVLYTIDATQIGGAILILSITMIVLATVLGVSVFASGLNSSSVKIIVYATVLTGIWSLLSILSYPLIISIEIFGSIIYVILTIGFVIGSFQLISGGMED